MRKGDKENRDFITTNAREQYLIDLAMDQAEKQLRDGTAPASTVNYFLKLGSEEARIKKQFAQAQIELLEAKRDSITASKEEARIYQEAIDAIKSYGYSGPDA